MGEIGRRVVHASGVVFPAVYLLDIVTWDQLGWLLILGFLVATILETLRLRIGLDWWIYEHLTRPYEAETVAGYGLYMVSITIVGITFEPAVAIPAMLMLMVGDPVSGYLGRGELRRLKHPIAIVGMFLVSLAVTVPFTHAALDTLGWAVLAAVLGAAGGTIADAIKPTIGSFVVDDNLTIPIFGAIVLWITYRVLPPAF